MFRLNSSEEISENSIDWDTLTGNIVFLDQYLITYEIDQKNETVISIAREKDSSGNKNNQTNNSQTLQKQETNNQAVRYIYIK